MSSVAMSIPLSLILFAVIIVPVVLWGHVQKARYYWLVATFALLLFMVGKVAIEYAATGHLYDALGRSVSHGIIAVIAIAAPRVGACLRQKRKEGGDANHRR